MDDAGDGLVCAYVFDARGGGSQVGWDELREWRPARGPLWVHLDRGAPQAEAWLRGESGLGELAVDALIAEETRPRCVASPDGLLIILRGVNLNPGADPEDMVSLRVWVDAARVITLRRRFLVAVQEVRDELAAGDGPSTPGALVAALAERLIDHIERAAVTQEELASRLSETINRRMYVLSLVAAVFLPLGLLTGLLGVNVGGVPGSDNPWGFAIVTASVIGFGGAITWWLRSRRLF